MGMGCATPSVPRSSNADKGAIGENGKLALVMRSYTPPDIHCKPRLHGPPYSPACTGAIDSMPFSRRVHLFGPVHLPGTDVALPQLYSEREFRTATSFPGAA